MFERTFTVLKRAKPKAPTNAGTSAKESAPQPTTDAPLAVIASFLAKSAPAEVHTKPKMQNVSTATAKVSCQDDGSLSFNFPKSIEEILRAIKTIKVRTPRIPANCCDLNKTIPPKTASTTAAKTTAMTEPPIIVEEEFNSKEVGVSPEKSKPSNKIVATIAIVQNIRATVRTAPGAAFAKTPNAALDRRTVGSPLRFPARAPMETTAADASEPKKMARAP